MSKAILYIVSLGIICLIVSAMWPYWNKYRISTDLKAAAIYGTKNSIRDTREFLREKIEERGYDFVWEEFYVEKDENNTVTISWTYEDKISLFGLVLKNLEFTLEVTERETEAML